MVNKNDRYTIQRNCLDENSSSFELFPDNDIITITEHDTCSRYALARIDRLGEVMLWNWQIAKLIEGGFKVNNATIAYDGSIKFTCIKVNGLYPRGYRPDH